MINNTKTAINNINIFTKHLPVIGSFSEIINDIIDNVYNNSQTKKLQNKTQIISNIVKTKFHNVEELELALTYSTFHITNSRKETILQIQFDLDNPIVTPNKGVLPKLENLKKLVISDNNIKSIDDELIKLAIQDTILLIIALYKNHDFIINNNENFSNQVRSIFENNNCEELVNTISNHCSLLDDKHLLKTVGSAATSEDIF